MRIRTALSLALALLSVPQAPAVLQNGDFEAGTLGAAPDGWYVPPASANAGYVAKLTDERPKSGARAAMLAREAEPEQTGFGNLSQSIDAVLLRGKRLVFRASVRTTPGARAQLWMRVDRTENRVGFFDNMGERPIVSADWAEYRIDGEVATDATRVIVGLMLIGEGKAWMDAASLEPSALTVRNAAPPRALTPRGLDNVVAFTRLLGYVRYFHPSDQASATNWEAFAIEHIGEAEGAASAAELATTLDRLFQPIAPTITVQPSGRGPAGGVSSGQELLTWRHRGVGLGQSPIYSSTRGRTEQAPPPLTPDLGGGVLAVIPLAAFGRVTATAPVPATPMTSAADRQTRLAGVTLAWNVFQHFYPYFDVVKTDWSRVLRDTLTAAATDADELAFLRTLRLMVAQLQDGHGSVTLTSAAAPARLPLFWDWIENRLVITAVGDGATPLLRGDVVAAIDGTPAEDALKDRERFISGSPQWRRWRGLNDLLSGGEGDVRLTVRTGDAPARDIRLARAAGGVPVSEPLPEKIAEVRPGIHYVDPDRITDQELVEALPVLSGARAVIIDLRGYPRTSPRLLQHLSAQPLQSARFEVPIITRPDREAMQFDGGGRWNLAPMQPRLTGKIVWITDGRAISYAESCMGIVEHYKIGEIVGSATAGANGNVNPFTLPGGYRIGWTGMRVTKHDGSQHHLVGIRPTIPVSRTIRGVAGGRDELLERAIEVAGR